MKSFFLRLRLNNKQRDESSPSTRPSSSLSLNKDSRRLPFLSRPASSYSASHDGLGRSPTPIAALHSRSSSSASESTQPHSIRASEETGRSSHDGDDPDDTIRGAYFDSEDIHVKKVTFQSPAPTPTASVLLEGNAQSPKLPIPPGDKSKPLPPSPVQSPSLATETPTAALPRPAFTHPRATSRQPLPGHLKKAFTRRGFQQTSSANGDEPSSAAFPSAHSDHSLASMSTRSYLPQPNSWSEMAEDDLIANLGPKERTRQEVLWEIVSSEERYVQELLKLSETFCRALLPSTVMHPSLRSASTADIASRAVSPALSTGGSFSITDYFGDLPIASQHSQNRPVTTPDPRSTTYAILNNGRQDQAAVLGVKETVPGPRSHHSLPPFSRAASGAGSMQSARMSYHPGAKRTSSRVSSFSSVVSTPTVGTHLPDSLEKVLSVLVNGILEGHLKLAAALRRRYDDQYPLVRSLADIFNAHSYILREYAVYVLHLEKALNHVDAALTAYTTVQNNKRASRRLEETDLGRLGKILLCLEEIAAEKGEAGLAISLSKPFQRLLKYPLLFQNLLYNTDPSLKEYEATLAMVDEVETIMRSIEDQKASYEEREKTRDVWARIDGVDQDKMIVAPKPDRLLISETQISDAISDPHAREAMTEQKKSFRRLSHMLKGAESAELWIIRFADVSLLCERRGTTNLPMSSKFHGRKSESISELSGRGQHATMGRRYGAMNARNLYRFVKVHEWHTDQADDSESISVEAEAQPSAQIDGGTTGRTERRALPALPKSEAESANDFTVHLSQTSAKIPLKADDGTYTLRRPTKKRIGDGDGDTDTTGSERLSVMSFAFKGSEQVQPPGQRVRPSAPPIMQIRPQTTSRASSRKPSVPGAGRQARREVSGDTATAKFAHRLRSADADGPQVDTTTRPTSRVRKSLPATVGPRGRASPALSVADGNAPRSAPTVVTDKHGSKPSTPSIEPSTRDSGKGATSRMETSVTGSGTRYVPIKTSTVRPSPSTDSGVATMWTAYRDGGAVGTPKRPAAGPERHRGGRI